MHQNFTCSKSQTSDATCWSVGAYFHQSICPSVHQLVCPLELNQVPSLPTRTHFLHPFFTFTRNSVHYQGSFYGMVTFSLSLSLRRSQLHLPKRKYQTRPEIRPTNFVFKIAVMWQGKVSDFCRNHQRREIYKSTNHPQEACEIVLMLVREL